MPTPLGGSGLGACMHLPCMKNEVQASCSSIAVSLLHIVSVKMCHAGCYDPVSPEGGR